MLGEGWAEPEPMSPNPTPRPPNLGPGPSDLPEDAVEQGPVCPLSSIVLGARTVPVGLATRGRPLLPFSGPGGVLATPRGLRALLGGLLPRAAGDLTGPSEPLLPLAASLPRQGGPLSATTGSQDPLRGLLWSGGWVRAMLPPHLLFSHVERGDRAQRSCTREHPCFSGPIKQLILCHPEG